ncbi:aspartate/glutamate racemase family protein [Leifsonia sp. Root112D2]|uniref:aspartate/glutamate racemase family protein n=1 Tax=Leifsonia sp. Root112D2 TaxID=1736426 RepID=UPI003FA5A3BA
MSYAGPGLEIGITSVPVTPYTHLTRAEVDSLGAVFIDAFRQAEAEGYDAVVPLGTLDLGVWGGKSAVGIPVVGPTEAMLHMAAMVGDAFGLITYGPQASLVRALLARYGMSDKVLGIRTSGYDLPDIAANETSMIDSFLTAGRELVELGADVILPMGISQCPVHISPEEVSRELGVPVVEGFGAPLRLAAAMADLRIVIGDHARQQPVFRSDKTGVSS